MRPRSDFYEDFGLSGYTKYVHSPFVAPDEAGCLDMADLLFEREGRVYAQEVLEDTRRLVLSALPDDVLSTLWLAATRAHFEPAQAGLGIRVWLSQIADTCTAFVRQDDPAFIPGDPIPADQPELREAVLAELRTSGPSLAEAAVTNLYAPPLPNLVRSLELAINELGSDLGLRLYLRSMKAYFVPIGPAQLQRLRKLGSKLGYHPCVVGDGNLNIWSDLEG
ncbi:hypothetical protein [Kitasatospora sp. NPDC047058]|uniref:hypothetical protein n=1 Tax=Kitasatospora sp. NPDC047058 TaxID=3155620 RepID=UPI00340D8585